MKQKTVLWIVLGLVAEKILQHCLTAIFFVFNIDGIGKPDIGNRIPLSDPAMAVLNCVMMGSLFGHFWIFRNHEQGVYIW